LKEGIRRAICERDHFRIPRRREAARHEIGPRRTKHGDDAPRPSITATRFGQSPLNHYGAAHPGQVPARCGDAEMQRAPLNAGPSRRVVREDASFSLQYRPRNAWVCHCLPQDFEMSPARSRPRRSGGWLLYAHAERRRSLRHNAQRRPFVRSHPEGRTQVAECGASDGMGDALA